MLWRYSRRDTKVLLVATLLVFSGYGLLLARSWSDVRSTPLAATTVGVVASVEGNKFNTLAKQLDERERAINAREMALLPTDRGETTHLALVTAGGIGLLVLILLNFYLDHRRRVHP